MRPLPNAPKQDQAKARNRHLHETDARMPLDGARCIPACRRHHLHCHRLVRGMAHYISHLQALGYWNRTTDLFMIVTVDQFDHDLCMVMNISYAILDLSFNIGSCVELRKKTVNLLFWAVTS